MTEAIVRAPDAAPAAYIRRSVVSRKAPGDNSREFQLAAVGELASAEAAPLQVFDGDWGRSGSRHEAEGRTAFRALLDAIGAGHVTTLYAYATDRLARDVEAAARLLNLCERAGVPIVTREGRIEPGDSSARRMYQFAAMTNEDYSDRSRERQASNVATRRVHGDAMGPPPWGKRVKARARGEPVSFEDDPERDPQQLLAAYREAGSINGAVRLLNDRGVLPQRATRWYSGPLGRTLKRLFPEEFSLVTAQRRVRSAEPGDGREVPVFRRVLRCHCGAYMTAVKDRDGTYDAYRCSRGLTESALGVEGRRKVTAYHPHGISVPSRVVRAWAMNEAAKFDQLAIEAATTTGPTTSQAELAERKRRAGVAFARGALDDAAFEDEMRDIERLEREAVAQAEARRFLRLRRGVRWDASPADDAADVKRLWRAIHLDEHMRPVRADWRVQPPATDADVVEATR